MQAQALNGIVPAVSIPWLLVIVAVPAVLMAVFGYKWIHKVQPYLAVIITGSLIAIVVQIAVSGDHLAKGMSGTHAPSFPVLIAVVGLFFMSMLSWAVFASDYSRYLPKDVSGPKVFSARAIGVSTLPLQVLQKILDRH